MSMSQQQTDYDVIIIGAGGIAPKWKAVENNPYTNIVDWISIGRDDINDRRLPAPHGKQQRS